MKKIKIKTRIEAGMPPTRNERAPTAARDVTATDTAKVGVADVDSFPMITETHVRG